MKLLEEGKLNIQKLGKHRRIKYEDVIDCKKKMKEEQKKRLIGMMHVDEDLGICDS